MNPSKETELIGALVDRTRNGDIFWTPNALNSGFVTEIDGSFLELRKIPGGLLSTSSDGLTLEIRKSDGTVVDKIEAAQPDTLASMLRGTRTLPALWKLLSGEDVGLRRHH